MSSFQNIDKLSDHLFRRTSGKMVSVLTAIFGPENLETAEDVVQQTFIEAIQTWKLKGIPDNPPAWLFRVAKNKAIDIIRRNKHSVQFDFSDHDKLLLTSEYTVSNSMDNFWKEELIQDDLLRMMFACCHPGITNENQIVLILKTLCGFSTAEIAKAFLSPEDTISKRLYRTREFFRENKVKFVIPSVAEMKQRTDAVLNSIYLIFNEGYNSTNSSELIRKDLVDEAMMLCKLLLENKHTQVPEAFALMALMSFHAARFQSRLTPGGDIILLADQDRSKWDRELIAHGNDMMNRSAFGDSFSTYHLEAAIAYEHCTAPDFKSTNWKRILELYEYLCKLVPSPVASLNKAVAVMHVHGPAKALESVQEIPEQGKLEKFYLYHSLLGEIYSRMKNTGLAVNYFENAMKLTQSDTERRMLREKIGALKMINN